MRKQMNRHAHKSFVKSFNAKDFFFVKVILMTWNNSLMTLNITFQLWSIYLEFLQQWDLFVNSFTPSYKNMVCVSDFFPDWELW